ncbi:unnamed protein product [Orchesella dallaii]|uniref:Ionotropic glutamate receptor C-terminal domain-containing protein n=1 Tax=Orchesella dallaii TaxID=48710 RepID=A0ABP1QAJ7_9HEXA
MTRSQLQYFVVSFLLTGNYKFVSSSDSDILPALYHDGLWKSKIFSELTQCTGVFLFEGNVVDEGTARILEEINPQDKFLSTFSDQNITSSSMKITDVHKLRNHCSVAFIQVSSAYEFKNTTEILYELLKHLNGIIKKDEDYFIFHSAKGENIDALFASGLVAYGVKNKLGIKLSNNKSVSYYSTCFYCDNGMASLQVISIPNHNSTSFQLSSSTSSILFPDLLKNFHGKQFNVSTPVLATWLISIREISPGYWKIWRGIMNSCFEELMRKYNFTAKYFPSIGGGGTGYFIRSNKTWIGTVGDVISGRADIGQTTGQIYYRNKEVGFSFPISYEWLIFTTGNPLPHYSWKSIYWPFESVMWLLIFGSMVISYFALKCFLKYTHQQTKHTNKKVVFYLVKSFLEQDAGNPETVARNTTRLFISFWLIFALLITTAYRSKLVSFLAFPMVEYPPTTFESLAYSTKFEMALQYLRGAAYSLLKTSTNPTFQTIYRKMGLEENDARCFQRAIGKHFACISWDAIANFVYHRNLSDKFGRTPLIKAPDTTSFIVVGLIFEKRAIFRTKFNQVISRSHDTGLMGKWRELDYVFIRKERLEWEKAVNRSQITYSYGSSEALTTQHLSGTFYLLWLGTFLAALTFFGEKLAHFLKSRTKQQQQPKPSVVIELQVTTVNTNGVHLLFSK